MISARSLPLLKDHPGCNPDCRVCHYKHLSYSEQIERKNRWARSQLEPWQERLAPIQEAHPDERLHYRRKSWLRVQCLGGGEFSFGMFRSVRQGAKWVPEFVAWDACPMHSDSIRNGIVALKKDLRRVFDQPSEAEKAVCHTATASWVGLWVSGPLGDQDWTVISRAPHLDFWKQVRWEQICGRDVSGVYFHQNAQVGRQVFGHLPIQPLFLRSKTDPCFPGGELPRTSFQQTARGLLDEARQNAVQFLFEVPNEIPTGILDLYCGDGDLVQRIPVVTQWVGIEQSLEAVQIANRSMRALGRADSQAFVGNVEHRLEDPRVTHLIGAWSDWVLYINPPRSGMSEEALQVLASLVARKPPKKMAYLSCSASSLARNLRVIEPWGYRVQRLIPYDFFPQTEHFEILALLERF